MSGSRYFVYYMIRCQVVIREPWFLSDLDFRRPEDGDVSF